MTTKLEQRLGALLRRGWILDGAGPARYGWASIQPGRERWEGRTLREIRDRLDARDAARRRARGPAPQEELTS